MATELTGRTRGGAATHGRLRPGDVILLGLAEFCAAVGVGSLLLGQAAAVWFLAAAALVLVELASLG